jgi:hypothetical protein
MRSDVPLGVGEEVKGGLVGKLLEHRRMIDWRTLPKERGT